MKKPQHRPASVRAVGTSGGTITIYLDITDPTTKRGRRSGWIALSIEEARQLRGQLDRYIAMAPEVTP